MNLRANFVPFALAALLASMTVAQSAVAEPSYSLKKVASFDHQVTGVTASESGRLFVNFPRWTEDSEVSVAELLPNGDLKTYPDANWNAWRNAKQDSLSAGDHWVCVQSVVADKKGSLWVIDAGAPAQAQVVAGAPKLVKIDLASNRVAKVYPFGLDVAPQGSYLNDVRLSPDGKFAYITDSGTSGAIVVVNLETGKARRALDGASSTQFEKGVMVKADGKPLQRPDGRGVQFSADGIALSPNGDTLYWQAVKGNTLYKIGTADLQSAALGELPGKVQKVGENGPADGLLIDDKGTMYVSSVEDHAIKVRQGEDLKVLLQDKDMRWPDTFTQGPDGTVYVTDSRIPDMNFYDPKQGPALKTTLYKIEVKD
ncbi:major royal jelly family protein [Pseudomonas sp. RIT-PI-S]|uniref:major royal jelly family protein n=1 Tax=Pseudomonas sp. RIT-PI-S TaxID=3035295 RepID=UPI0021DAA1C0|nr:major royal jelly family protein [Pseudomonas sp. RIT-PI-S]